ncbi:hypothetical protein [Dysgonomonas sp. 511]|uniref:hypothetical protein n=1 Tax=Dysgonomonas sp. 511 TaxID=2302930 RepID=UPI0013D7DF95|nr:hypothetical protein [Dysgonomonas sp. 511]NDV79323.1 hypothetical protein [Dysgonomonas sp. 511]
MDDAVNKVLHAISADVLQIARSLMETDRIGKNPKTGRNTLADSRLKDEVEVNVAEKNGSLVVETLFSNYIDYLEHGRRPRQGKQPPIDALRDWALSRGIPTDNSTLFLISRAIWRDGQQPRPILATLEEEVERMMDEKWNDELLEAISHGLAL